MTGDDRADACAVLGDGTYPVLDQRFDGTSLYQLRAAVAVQAAKAGLPRQRADDMVMTVHELAVNSVRHGPGRGRLRIWKHQQTVICQVSDDGVDGNPDLSALPWPVEPGHGLWLVRQLADHVIVQSGAEGASATVSFAAGPPGTAPPFLLARSAVAGCTILTVAGQLDLTTCGRLTGTVQTLADEDPGLRLVIDLGGLTFWDTFGMAALLKAQATIDAIPAAKMIMAALPGQLAERLRESGLIPRFVVAETTDQATGRIAPTS
jgi:anti-anti-sigma factor